MIQITNDGKTVVAEILSQQHFSFAWGRGNPNWSASDYTSAANSTAKNLADEVGRRKIAIIAFAAPDAAGEIETSDANYSVVTTPTDLLYLRVNFDYNDNQDEVIREVGIFTNAQFEPSLPLGQQFFTPSEVTSTGTLFASKRLEAPIYRTANTRQSFDFIIPVVV